MINWHIKFEMSKITCNEDTKSKTKVCKNTSFELPLGRFRGKTQGSSMAQWKVHCRLPISDN